MADSLENSIKDRYKDKLTPMAYIQKQLYDFMVSFGSAALGAVIGSAIGSAMEAKKTKKSDAEHPGFNDVARESLRDWVGKYADKVSPTGGIIGFFVGSMIGQIVQGYDRWKKHEAGRLAVAEVNQDIANITVLKQRTNPELVQENQTLREMYATVKTQNEALLAQKTPVEKLLEEGARTPGETRETTTTMERV